MHTRWFLRRASRAVVQRSPTLILASHSTVLGEKFGYHAATRAVAQPILDALRIPYHVLRDAEEIPHVVKQIVRTIRDFAGLYDISVVTNPAYPGTCVDARYTLVAAEVRSRVAEFGPNTPEHSQEVRKRFAERAEEASELQARRRRDLLEQV